MVRKSLSVGPDTWKALSALGRFGMSFDDIIKILLLEHNELMRNKGQKEIPLGPAIYALSPEAQDQMQLTTEYQSQQQHDEGIKAPIRESKGEAELHLVLPGLRFPTNKEKLMQIAKRYDSTLEEHQEELQSVTPYVEKLPDTKRTYKDESQLEEDIKKICNTDKELIDHQSIFGVDKVVGVIISKSVSDEPTYRLKTYKKKSIEDRQEKQVSI